VELAPTKIWPRPLEVPASDIDAYARFWHDRGLEIVALQALLFGQPELSIFGDAATRERTLKYLEGICHVGSRLGAKVLVFGSPRNRKAGAMSPAVVEAMARDFFARAGKIAADCDVVLCIEPNPSAYECDFVTTADEGSQLVHAVASPGFGLHLDSAGMFLSKESITEVLARHGRSLRHFHVSEPFLRPVGPGTLDHPAIAAALRQSGYANWVSIEMRQPEGEGVLECIDRVLGFVKSCYGRNVPI
jgi:sugar phosphate isomerase/epimerase